MRDVEYGTMTRSTTPRPVRGSVVSATIFGQELDSYVPRPYQVDWKVRSAATRRNSSFPASSVP